MSTTDVYAAVPPHSADAEKTVIGAMMQDAKTAKMIIGKLCEDDFYMPQNRAVFAAAAELAIQRKPIDLLTVTDAMDRRGDLDIIGREYLLQAILFVPTVINIGGAVDIVIDRSRRRTLIAASQEFQRGIAGMTGDLDELVAGMRGRMRSGRGENKLVSAAKVAEATFDYIAQRADGTLKTVKMGIASLDAAIGGLLGGDMLVMGARPGVGKSAVAMDVVLNVAKGGKRVLVVSREMQQEQYGIRVASRLSGINGRDLKTAELADQQWPMVGDAFSEFSQMGINFLFDVRNVEELASIAQEMYDNGGLDLIVVDYLQLMGTAAKSQQRYQEVGAVSRGLKELAMTLKVPLIALAQVKRAQEGRVALCPQLTDLRESGDIEQDADIVILLHHPESASDPSIPEMDLESYEQIEMQGRLYLVAKIAKQRMGVTGPVGLDFDPSIMAVRSLEW